MGCSKRQPRICIWGSGTDVGGTTISTSHSMGLAIDLRRKPIAAVVADSYQQCRCRYDDVGDLALRSIMLLYRYIFP